MEKISDIVSSSEFLAQRDNKEQEKDLDPLTVLVVNRLFNFFEALCPGFDKQYRGSDTKLKTQKVNFARAFMDEGINDIKQIEFGVKKCRRESPINTPTVGQFLNWCKPTTDDLGLWSKEQAFNHSSAIMRGDIPANTTPEQLAIIQHAINESDRHFMRNNPITKTQPVFYRCYDIAVRDFIAGKLKPIPKAIVDNASESAELDKQHMINSDFAYCKGYENAMPWIRRILGMPTDGSPDPRGLAKRRRV